MKKLMPLVASIIVILVAGLFAGAGALAYFNDTETSDGNRFEAGTLDLKVGGQDDGGTVFHVTLTDMKPGDKWWHTFVLKNTGTIPGQPWVEFSTIKNYENGQNEPEALVDTTAGDLEGELGRYLHANIGKGGTVIYWYAGPLNTFSGKTFGDPSDPKYTYPTIGQNEEVKFKLTLELLSTVGNIVQSDSVEFDIIFHLDQA